MNPFAHQTTPPPAGACGERGFSTAADAKTSAQARSLTSYVIMHWRTEFAWISPVEVFLSRVMPAIAAGIRAVEIKTK